MCLAGRRCFQTPALTPDTPCPSPAVDLLLNERQVVTREVRGGYYNPSAYLLSKLTLDASECLGVPSSASSLWPIF